MPGVLYYRWHGSPRPYFSTYTRQTLERLAANVTVAAVDTWCVFDNTGSGAAAANALYLRALLNRVQGKALMDDEFDAPR